MKDNTFYLNTFRTEKSKLDRIVAEALSGGGDYADLYFEYTTYNDLVLMDSEVSSGGFHVDYGVGIRVLSGERTGYAYSESTEMADMLAAARAAGAIAGTAHAIPPQAVTGTGHHKSETMLADTAPSPDFYPQQGSWRDCNNATFVPLLKELEAEVTAEAAKIADPSIRLEKVVAKISFSESDVMMYNSLGELRCDTRPLGSVVLSAVYAKGGHTEQKGASRSFRKGPSIYLNAKEMADELAREVASGIEERFAAKRPKGGQMSVVMGCGASGILLHEAMGHAFEADFNRKGQSIFTGRMGEKICHSGISIVDDGTLTGNRGACNWDDEGIRGQKTYMVRDGVLESYLHDRISAAHFGVEPTGNGRREGFRFNPIPRMRTTYMENGDANPADIIASVKKGIFVDEFSNGQVKIGEGDFTFYVKSGYMIENGHLGMPIKDINIIGNGPQALSDIIMVGNDLKIDNGTWTCGKEQSVAVSCGIPTVLVSSLTVGGE